MAAAKSHGLSGFLVRKSCKETEFHQFGQIEQATGVRFYFVDYPPYFDREALYGTPTGDYPDNAERFAMFARAVLEASKVLGVPNVFHCHDWQSALLPVLLRTHYTEDPAFRDVGTALTIHNIGYQGLFPPDILPLLMLPWDLFTIAKMEFFGQVNFLKGALVFSDFVTTVSKKYSHEIQTTEYGFGLEGVLRSRAATVTGILNGVDYDDWSPQSDKFIAAKYSPQDLSGKKQCKQDLLNAFGVTGANLNLPVIGIVSRFAAQKGFDLISQIMDRLALEDAPEVQPLHERQHEPVLERRVQGQLQQQVFDGGPHRELALPRPAPRPQRLGVQGEEPRRRGRAAVQLDDHVQGRLVQHARVVGERELLEAGGTQRGGGLAPALEREQVDVAHGAIGLEVVDRLRERCAFQRQRANASA